jgi:hypothetical protein
MTLNGETLYLEEILEAGLHRDMRDLRPIAERLREVATAIETFEQGRQPVSGAEAITDFLTSLPGPFAGETGQRRLEKKQRELEEKTPESMLRELVVSLDQAEHPATKEQVRSILVLQLAVQHDRPVTPEEVEAFIQETRQEMAEEERGTA